MTLKQGQPMTEMEILQAALAREKAAYAFYDALLQGSHVDFLRDLLEVLRDAEGKHIQLVEQRITQLNLGRG